MKRPNICVMHFRNKGTKNNKNKNFYKKQKKTYTHLFFIDTPAFLIAVFRNDDVAFRF